MAISEEDPGAGRDELPFPGTRVQARRGSFTDHPWRQGAMNEQKLMEFMGKLVNDMGGAAMLANVIVGEELGLYRAMADSQPVTPQALAEKTTCNPRLVREWLSAHVASGYMEHHDGQFR